MIAGHGYVLITVMRPTGTGEDDVPNARRNPRRHSGVLPRRFSRLGKVCRESESESSQHTLSVTTAAAPFLRVDQASNAFPHDLSEGLLPATMRYHITKPGGSTFNGICTPMPALPDPGAFWNACGSVQGRGLRSYVETCLLRCPLSLLVRLFCQSESDSALSPVWSRFDPVVPVVPSLPKAPSFGV
ncbi:hypothetical protein BJV78DRAFT_1152584 [Lactifluus subvellereus]|nr:hypothetical protein BJV78DRAFT_1152584 [Lactifluus subvellereus]